MYVPVLPASVLPTLFLSEMRSLKESHLRRFWTRKTKFYSCGCNTIGNNNLAKIILILIHIWKVQSLQTNQKIHWMIARQGLSELRLITRSM